MGLAVAGRSRFAGRGGIFTAIVALHVVAVGALLNVGMGKSVQASSEPVEVAFIEMAKPEVPPPVLQPRLAAVQTVDPVMPVVNLPVENALSNAITVVPPKAEPRQVVAVSEAPVVVDRVDYLRPPAPSYPPAAKRARVQGIVMLHVVIDHDGKPREVRIHESSGSEQLDAAARASVMSALFRPYRENGVPRLAQVLVPVQFSLSIRTARSARDYERFGGGRGEQAGDERDERDERDGRGGRDHEGRDHDGHGRDHDERDRDGFERHHARN